MSYLSLTVKDVLERPYFKHSIIIAGREGINRVVTWVHIVEIEKISHLLNGGELILSTGIGWGTNKQARLSFLKQLIERQAAALCIELGTSLPYIPDDMVRIAEHHQFPIIVFSEEVRFIDITQDLHSTLYELESKRRQETGWIKDWLNGRHRENEITRHFEQINVFPIPHSAVVCLGRINSDHPQQNDVMPALERLLIMAHSAFEPLNFHVLSTVDDQNLILILLNYDLHENWKKRVNEGLDILKQTTPDFKENDIIFSIGNVVNALEQISKSYEAAKKANQIQQNLKKRGNVFYEDLHIYRIVHAAAEAGELADFVTQYLQPLIDYDREKQSEMIQTLKTFLACNGSKRKTAERLFIVRQTLYHRLQKLEQLLGSDFMEPEKRLAIEFAIHAYEYMKGTK